MDSVIIFGGTFNPPHAGHVAMAEAALAEMPNARMLVIPTLIPPHKLPSDLAGAAERMEMCRLAFGHLPVMVSDIELNRAGPSYTSDTVRELAAESDDTKLCFLCGMDMFASLDRWHESDYLKSKLIFMVAGRPDSPDRDEAICAFNAAGGRAMPVKMPLCGISSTDIRNRALPESSDDPLLPAAVAEYIAKHKLYQK